MKTRQIFDAISIVAATAAVAEQATTLLAPYAPDLRSYVPRIVRTFPTRVANAAHGFMRNPDATSYKPQRATRPHVVAASPRPATPRAAAAISRSPRRASVAIS
jgi:hypothetical protein